MNKNIISAITFAAGAAIGSLVTWKVVKSKYDNKIDALCDEVNDLAKQIDELVYAEDDEVSNNIEETVEEPVEEEDFDMSDTIDLVDDEMGGIEVDEISEESKPKVATVWTEADRKAYYDKVDELGYWADLDAADKAEEKQKKKEAQDKMGSKSKKPYIVPYADFGDAWGTDRIETLTYYGNGVLAYWDTGEIIEDINATVGLQNLKGLGSEEIGDEILIRNEQHKMDYEVLWDPDSYEEQYSG